MVSVGPRRATERPQRDMDTTMPSVAPYRRPAQADQEIVRHPSPASSGKANGITAKAAAPIVTAVALKAPTRLAAWPTAREYPAHAAAEPSASASPSSRAREYPTSAPETSAPTPTSPIRRPVT